MAQLVKILSEICWRLVSSVAALLVTFTAFSADIDVTVVDRDGEPVAGVVVYIQANQAAPLPPPVGTAVMDQIDTRFVPHLLVVQAGTQVEFPNSDVVAHHVYSFSKPNNFMLPLYKGELQPHVTFKHAGVATLGCNIHDHMLGYILIVDSQVFGKTGYDGNVQLTTANPDGLTVNIWSPRIKLKEENLSQSVGASRSAQITFSLTEKLRARHSDDTEALTWNEY